MFRRNTQDDDLDKRLSTVPYQVDDNLEEWPPPELDAPEHVGNDSAALLDIHHETDVFQPGGPARNTSVSVVAPNAHWHGTLQSTGAVQVFGEVEGERIVAADLLIAEGARVSASISSINLTVAGIVTGTISCTNRFEVLSSGEVHGEVTSPTIIVHEGARVIGMMSMAEPEPVEEEEDPDSGN